ncbi:hypothetical protein Cgig2_030110 [Carnegiea gigantea]|uniref:Uncharacterized protein n=1 Tax=Carnegiea gigantea TaxID=171969 RepID=A0A9Q1Q6K3_9CARY|nr:hypothetical protein Cgig2_030110 [Carnegiea gigantea]
MGDDNIAVEIHHRGKFMVGVGWNMLETLALPSPSRTTQQSNVDPISITKSNGEECCQKGGLDRSTSTIGCQNSKDTRVKHTPTKSSIAPRLESPIPWDKFIKGDSLSEEFGDSEYVPKTELELEAFEDIAGSISKTRRKRKINMSGVIDDHGCENDSDKHHLDSDWGATRAKIAECKKQKVLERIATTKEVGKQDTDKAKSATTGNE